MRFWQAGMVMIVCGVLSACANTNLRELDKPGEGPDEFRIVPGKPLQAPDDLAQLPEPTPGGSNLTDPQPLQDSVAVLGGRRPAASGAVPSGDGAIVNHASRFGRDGTIRQQLATADEDFRRRRGRFTNIRIVREDNYSKVYRNEVLDAFREQRRWRRAGARTPSAPPQ